MTLCVLNAGGFDYYWTTEGCLGWSSLRGNELATVQISPACRATPEAREIFRLLIERGARWCPALDAESKRLLEIHGWTRTEREDHRGAIIYTAPIL